MCRAIQDRKTKKWKFSESGEYLYDSESEAIEKGRIEISIKLNKGYAKLSKDSKLSK